MTLFDKAIIRLPALPFSRLKELETKILDNSPLDPAVQELLLEAIFISSPEFYSLLKAQMGDSVGIRDEKIKLSVVKYLNRMCQRATPYGTMAYISTIGIDDHTTEINPEAAKLHRVVRLDSEIAVSVLKLIQTAPEYADHICYYPNNSLYEIGNKLRYVETVRSNGSNKYKLSSVDSDGVVKKLLKFANGGKTRQALGLFVERIYPDGQAEDICDYLQDLIDNDILISSLSLNVGDTDVIQKIQDFLADYQGAQTVFHLQLIDSLRFLDDLIEDSRICDPVEAVENYQKIQVIISSLLKDVDPKKSFVQVDTYKDFQSKINRQIPLKLQAVVESLAQINPLYKSEQFAAFTEAFAERYEGRSIKLMHALDPDIGLGYPFSKNIQNEINDPMLSLVNNITKDNSNTLQYYFSDWHRLLIEKYQECRKNGENEIHLSLSEMRPFELPQKHVLPKTYTLLCKLSAGSHLDLDAGKYLIQPFDLHAPSAANVYSRFTHLNQDMEGFAKEIIDYEQSVSNQVNVEFEHIGQTRTANVTLKKIKRLKRVNITCGPVPGKAEQYLALDDIYIFYEQGKLILYSKSMKKRIIPFMTSAYNFNVDDLPIVSFIGDFQQQGNQNSLLWEWGALKEFNDLPRVVIDRKVVVSPAFWTLKRKDFNLTSIDTFHASFKELCKRRAVPQKVLFGVADNLMFIDLRNPQYLQMIYKEISKNSIVLLIENINDHDGSVVRSGGQTYASEILFSFSSNQGTFNKERSLSPFPSPKNGMFMPLDSWIYLKLYFSSTSTEQKIMQVIDSLVMSVKRKKMIDCWFFIRYEDPDPHIRLRFKISSPHFLSDVISAINSSLKPIVDQEKLFKLSYASYCPEIDRYGEGNMENIEQIFQIDSEFVTKYRRLHDQSENSTDLNWLIGIYTIDSYLSVCFSELERDKAREFCLRIKESMKKEFNFSVDSFKRVNKFFSENRDVFRKFMFDKHEKHIKITKLIHRREELLRHHFHKISCNDDIIFSIIHMSLNRLFPISPRKNEAICYDLYCKHVLPIKKCV